MGITVKSYGTIPVDRSVGLLVIYTDDDNPLNWRIMTQWQDTPYDGDTQLDTPRQNTEEVSFTFGDVKDVVLPSGKKISDLFADVKAACYALRQRKIDGTGPLAPAP